MKIDKNTTVIINYTLKDSDGVELESTKEAGAVTYLHGRGLMIPRLEEALTGRESGESLSVALEAADAYGERDDRMVVEIPRTEFDEPETLEIGEDIQVNDGKTGGIMTIVSMDDDKVTLDGNHPYSGKSVVFDINIIEIRETTQEDLDALSHHHDCGCDHDHSEGSCCGGDHEGKEDGCCSAGKGKGKQGSCCGE